MFKKDKNTSTILKVIKEYDNIQKLFNIELDKATSEQFVDELKKQLKLNLETLSILTEKTEVFSDTKTFTGFGFRLPYEEQKIEYLKYDNISSDEESAYNIIEHNKFITLYKHKKEYKKIFTKESIYFESVLLEINKIYGSIKSDYSHNTELRDALFIIKEFSRTTQKGVVYYISLRYIEKFLIEVFPTFSNVIKKEFKDYKENTKNDFGYWKIENLYNILLGFESLISYSKQKDEFTFRPRISVSIILKNEDGYVTKKILKELMKETRYLDFKIYQKNKKDSNE